MGRTSCVDTGCSMEADKDGRKIQVIDSEVSNFIGRLYQENYSRLLAHVLKKGYHLSVAEDIVHEAYFEAVKNPEKIIEHPNPAGWLMNTVKFKLMGFNRRMEILDPRDWAEKEYEIRDMEDEYGALELTMLVDSMLNPYERKLFRMYFLQGYSAKELAEQENITENNFKVRMCRIRAKLEKEVRKDV